MQTTSADYLIDWLVTVLDAKSPRTRESYAYVVRRLFGFLEAQHHPTELEELRPIHLRAFFAALRADGVSPNTIANFDRTLRAILGRIEREGREDFDLPSAWKNPLAPIEKQKPQPIRKTPLSEELARQLLRTAPRKGFIAYRNFAQLAFMLMTGARSIEVRHLRTETLSLDRRLADLRVTKGGKPRYVHLPIRLTRILANYLRRRQRAVDDEMGILFPTRSGGMQSRRSLHRSVRAAGRRAGIADLGPHRLRHSYVTLSHAKGAPLKFLQEQCGHSSVLVTQGYVGLSEGQKGELANRFCPIAG